MKLRLISDIHLELNPNKQVKLFDGDLVILAGDIGNPFHHSYNDFIKQCSEKYTHVVVIAGNHEYYIGEQFEELDELNSELKRLSFTNYIERVEDQIRQICGTYGNVHFLQKDLFVIDDICIFGCTLWSIPDPKLYFNINDFYKIPGMVPDSYYRLFKDHRNWLLKMVTDRAWEYDKVIIATHHMPSYSLVHEKYLSAMNCFFASDCDNIIKHVDISVSGHSHMSNMKKIGKCTAYVNPIGYDFEDTGYSDDLVIEI